MMEINQLNQNLEAQLMAEEPQPTLSMHPKKFMLWLFIVSVIMIFAAWTSAYLVRQAEGNWLEFEMPSIFWFNSAVLLVSSITMHWAYISAKKDNLATMKVAVLITFILGMVFLVGQWMGWAQLVAVNEATQVLAQGSLALCFFSREAWDKGQVALGRFLDVAGSLRSFTSSSESSVDP